jgi:hypothetical protein
MMDRNSLLEKIRALLSKTTENGCTEAEALSALDKARALMDAYEVTDTDLQLSKAEGAVLHSESPDARDPHKIKRYLGFAVAEFCDCKIWRSALGLQLCGFPSDVQFAAWLLDHLTDFVQAELVSYLTRRLAPKEERRWIIKGFVLGCTDKINGRLAQLCQRSAAERTDNSRALVVIKGAAITDKMNELGIKLRKSSSRPVSVNQAAHEAGHKAGDRVSFGRPVSGTAAVLRLRNGAS